MSLKSKLHLLPEEQIIQIIRQTGPNSFSRYLLGMLILLTNTFFTFWFWSNGFEGQLFYGLIWLLGLYITISTWIIDKGNIMVVTTERIFDIHRESIFRETISTLHFLEIGDVVVERRGVLSAIFNHGYLTIHPRQGNFVFELNRVKRPEIIQNVILERKGTFSQKNRFRSKDELLKQFLKTIPEYTESELTLVYQKINNYLLSLAEPGTGKKI